jgi:formylglycine-generating enzyme required for sulfatase activity
MAACGAFDLVGNVWEWTAPYWLVYSDTGKFAAGYVISGSKSRVRLFAPESLIAVRGASYADSGDSLSCGAQGWLPPDNRMHRNGLRIVIAALPTR